MKAFKSRKHLELATLVLVPMALFVSLAILVSLLPPATRGATAAAPYLQNAGFDRRVQWYFESGQWRADVTTLVAVVKYLVEPEPSQASILPSQLHHNSKNATEMRVAAEALPTNLPKCSARNYDDVAQICNLLYRCCIAELYSAGFPK